METQFNVLTEPWIVVSNLHGETRELGLLDLVAQAHQLNDLVDPSPAIQFGLYRLIIVFVQAALGLVEYEDLMDAWERHSFDPATFSQYATNVGSGRFDLFHPERPFLQSQLLPEDLKDAQPVVRLFYHMPAGTNVLHFVHTLQSKHAVSPAVAARALCSIAPFMTSGGAGYAPSINGTPPWYVLVKGANLFETILLNCCVSPVPGLNFDVPPPWEATSDLTPGAEKDVTSLAEAYTWQPRRVRLFPSPGGECSYTGKHSSVLIRRMAWGPGHKFRGQETWMDPHVSYRLDEKLGRLPLRPREGRELWRDYGPLLLLRGMGGAEHKYERPSIIGQLGLLKREGIVPEGTGEQIEAYGMRADKAKVFEWQSERLALPTGVLQNPVAGTQVEHALSLAERVSAGLYRSLKQLHPRAGVGNTGTLNRVIEIAQKVYWSDLEQHFQADYLRALAEQRPEDGEARRSLLAMWKQVVRMGSWVAFRQSNKAIGTGGDALRRQVLARATLAKVLASVLGDGGSTSKRTG